jgi:hypothetical protein
LKEEAMHTPFDDFLDQLTELRCNVAISTDRWLEPRVARLEHIVQQMLLALVEATPRENR